MKFYPIKTEMKRKEVKTMLNTHEKNIHLTLFSTNVVKMVMIKHYYDHNKITNNH